MVVLRLNTSLTPKPASVLVIDAFKYQTLLQNLTGGAGGGHGDGGVKVFSTFARTEEDQKISLRLLRHVPLRVPRGFPIGPTPHAWNVFSLPAITMQPVMTPEEDAQWKSRSLVERSDGGLEALGEVRRIERCLNFSRLIEF
jgi:hypothetical protein